MLGRFIQPDSIIPDPSNPADFDRYSYVRNNPVNYNDPDGHLPCVNGTFTCNNPHNTDPNPANPGQNNENKNPPFDSSLGGNNNTNQNIKSNQQNSTINNLSQQSSPNSNDNKILNSNNDKGDKTGESVAGAFLILFTDLFVGLPAAYVIVVTGGVTPPAIAAEAIELLVVLPINALGIYLMYDAKQR